jgi:ATP-dependent helicase/nuclease subunit B
MDGPFLEPLAAEVERSGPSLSPQVVLVGSNLLGRDLGRRIRERIGGWANLRFLTLLDLARVLAGPRSEGLERPPLSRAGKLALAREALRQEAAVDPGFGFARIAGRKGFPAALAALFEDFQDGGLQELPERSPVEPRRWGAIVALHRRWKSLLATAAVHPAETIARGALLGDQFRSRFGSSRLWVSGFYEMTPGQLALLGAVVKGGVEVIASLPFPRGRRGRFAEPLAAELKRLGVEVVGPELPQESQEPQGDLARLRAALFAGGAIPQGPAAEPDQSLVLVSAPDEEREVQEAARGALKLFERGIAFHRMAVTFPQGRRGQYAPLVEEVFSSAGIPFDGRRVARLSVSFNGRALRSLLWLLGCPSPPRARLLDFLGFDLLALPVSAGRLERLSRRGGIAVWSGDWKQRLRSAARPRPAEEGEDAPGTADPDVERAIPILERFLRLLADFPARGSWETLECELERIAETGFPPLLADPDLTRIASELRLLGGLEPETTLPVFRSAWEEELRAAPAEDEEERRQGVVVGDLMELRGLRFEAVFLLGAAERSFPAPPRSDPLLPDGDRAALRRLSGLEGRLALKGERTAEEDLLFAGVAASAAQLLQISFPRADSSTGRPLLPSIYFLQAASLLAGRPLAVEAAGASKLVRRIGLAHGGQPPPESLTVEELRLALAVQAEAGKLPRQAVRRALAALWPGLDRIARNEELKWERSYTAADGMVSRELLPLLPGSRITGTGGSISASRLETFALCPHRFLHRHLLNLDEPEDPEEVLWISPLDRGALAHRVLETAYRALQAERLLPLSLDRLPRAKEVLDRLFEEECRRTERKVPVGLPLFWEVAREKLREGLHDLLEREAREGGSWEPFAFELAFGREGEPPVVLEVPAAAGGPPVLSVHLSGKIDRLDLARSGQGFRVIDYKSGRLPYDPFHGGEALQLPLYLLAGKAILRAAGREARIDESAAAYLNLAGESRRFAGAGWADSLEKLRLVARTVASAIESGLFFQRPGKDRENCSNCSFKRVCDPRVETIAGRKEDRRADGFRAMKELP